MTPYFSQCPHALKDPLFSSGLFSLPPKGPYFGGHVHKFPSLPYMSPPPPPLQWMGGGACQNVPLSQASTELATTGKPNSLGYFSISPMLKIATLM